MREYINGVIYKSLPKEIKEIIIDTFVVSGHGVTDKTNFITIDKLYLLSTKEVWGGSLSYDTATAATRQLDYYKEKGVTTNNYSGAIKKYNGSAYYWWLRSAYSYNTFSFYRVNNYGGWGSNTAVNTFGVASAFRIG